MSITSSRLADRLTQSLLEELGEDTVMEALKQAVEMRRALKVIYTWSGFHGALDPDDVRKLCAKALRRSDGTDS